MTMTSAAHPAHGTQGFLLLTLNNVEATLPGATGPIIDQLALECVTVPENPSSFLTEPERDVWLVLKVGPNEMAISPTQIICYIRSERTFVFEAGTSGVGTESKWILKLPAPRGPADVEDMETFEVLLAQYAAVEQMEFDGPPPDYSDVVARYPASTGASGSQYKRPVPPPPTQFELEKPLLPLRSISTAHSIPPRSGTYDNSLRGRLVLVDESDGEIVGTLGEQFTIREDNALITKGHEKDPVIVDIPADGESAQATDVYVYPVPYEQQDKIMKTASIFSRGLVFATGAVTTGMDAASSLFISHSKPTKKPLEFSERTRGHVRRVHNISGKAVEVTAKTTGLIHEALERAVDHASGSNKNKGKSRATAPTPGTPPFPLPLKNRIFLATDMLLTTVEHSAKQLIEHGTSSVSEALGHKYGKDMRDASYLVGQSARNVGMVYIDARGVGRRALLKKAGARYVKAKLGSKDVVLAVDQSCVIQQGPTNPSFCSISPTPIPYGNYRSVESYSSDKM